MRARAGDPAAELQRPSSYHSVCPESRPRTPRFNARRRLERPSRRAAASRSARDPSVPTVAEGRWFQEHDVGLRVNVGACEQFFATRQGSRASTALRSASMMSVGASAARARCESDGHDQRGSPVRPARCCTPEHRQADRGEAQPDYGDGAEPVTGQRINSRSMRHTTRLGRAIGSPWGNEAIPLNDSCDCRHLSRSDNKRDPACLFHKETGWRETLVMTFFESLRGAYIEGSGCSL